MQQSEKSNVIDINVKPKTVRERYNGQDITLVFCPTAPESSRWRYVVRITRVYELSGVSRSEVLARKSAKSQIDDIVGPPQAAIKA